MNVAPVRERGATALAARRPADPLAAPWRRAPRRSWLEAVDSRRGKGRTSRVLGATIGTHPQCDGQTPPFAPAIGEYAADPPVPGNR